MSKTILNDSYDIANGYKTFGPIEMLSENAAIQVYVSEIDADNAEITIQQSIDNVNWHSTNAGAFTPDETSASSHIFNISEAVRGLMLRVSFSPGSATSGTIGKIICLT